jgi:hypothetical protein
MLNINQHQILSLPTILYEKENDIANLEKNIADAYLQIESLKKAYILTTDIESTIQKSIQQNKEMKDILIKAKGIPENLLNISIKQKDNMTEQKDNMTEQKDIMTEQLKKKSYILSIDEIHVRFFEFRYACQLYLKPPVKMGDKITIEHINQLLDNTEYWKDAWGGYQILGYVKKVNNLIEEEHTKPDKEKNIDLLLKLQTEKSNILEWILNLSNDLLVSWWEAQSTLQENSAQSS